MYFQLAWIRLSDKKRNNLAVNIAIEIDILSSYTSLKCRVEVPVFAHSVTYSLSLAVDCKHRGGE